jgi:hypothetical protein
MQTNRAPPTCVNPLLAKIALPASETMKASKLGSAIPVASDRASTHSLTAFQRAGAPNPGSMEHRLQGSRGGRVAIAGDCDGPERE